MTLPRRTRRRIDAVVGLGMAVVVAVVAVALWLGGDERATTLHAAPASAAPATPTPAVQVPHTLTQRWTLTTDARLGAVASVYGTVVTASAHTVTGHDATTGRTVWTYSRSNRTLCALGSGDSHADGLDDWSGVHGIMTLYAKNGYCSQVTLLNPNTGERIYQRTSPNQYPGRLFFGSPYVGWMGSDYLELWRHDLVATIRYGNQPNPVNADGPHTGCTFTDAAVTRLALATVEHCGSPSADATVVLNWPTPSDAPDKGDKGWDANHSTPKATIHTGSPAAVIVGLTDDRVAVAVSAPTPAVVVYDSAGKETSRTPVPLTAKEITSTAAAGITPSVTVDSRRYTLVGHHLLATTSDLQTVPAPPTTTSAPTNGEQGVTQAPSTTTTAPAAPTTITVENPVISWIADDAIGLPAIVGEHVLVPVVLGLAVRNTADGAVTETIPVNRGGDSGRVDATAIGTMIVEVRGDHVVGLS